MTLKKDYLERITLSKSDITFDVSVLRQKDDMNRRIQDSFKRNEEKIARSYKRASGTQIR